MSEKDRVGRFPMFFFKEIFMKKTIRNFLVGVGVAGFASSALAVSPTSVSELASAVSFEDVASGILAVAGTVISLYVTWKGAKFIIRAVKGA